MGIKYIVLLNEVLKKDFLKLNEKEKRRMREKFEFLENGMWDTGLKVKKLKGLSNKVIFEGRIDKGNRLIFILGKHQSDIAIYVWGMTKHDDISKSARRIIPENAPFLNFQSFIEKDVPEIILDDLNMDYFTQEDIDEVIYDDYGPQKWLVIDEKEWKRLLLKTETFQDDYEIYLFLTKEQETILKERPPLLLSGTAGSGKTTIGVYYLLKKEFLDKKRIFLTYNKELKKFSSKIYSGLIKNTDVEISNNHPEFFVFKDLLFKIIQEGKVNVDLKKEVDIYEFKKIYTTHNLAKKYDPELVWEEIRSIIKGAKPQINFPTIKRLYSKIYKREISQKDINELKNCFFNIKNLEFFEKIKNFIEEKTRFKKFDIFLNSFNNTEDFENEETKYILDEIYRIIEKRAKNFSSPLLSFNEYLILGKKRAPNFLFDRKDIYSIAEYYNKKMEEAGLWDEIDLCKKAISVLMESPQNFSYDLIVCDEVQDFAEIQLQLIFMLAKNWKNIVLIGDKKQVINPSGFRWEEVKEKFYERGINVPDVHRLILNFRSVGSIVKLANALLDIKQKIVGLEETEIKETWKFNGKPPVLLYAISEEEIIKELMIKGANQIVLVRNENEKNYLKEKLKTELIFTINEAKGLEFDAVFVWKFLSDKKSLEIWRKIKNEDFFISTHYPYIKHEINLLYVAVTRARNSLVFYDGIEPSDIWNIELIKDMIFKTKEKQILSDIWKKISTPEQWEKQGDYFFEREYFPAALECYKNSENKEKIEICEAFLLEKEKNYLKSALLFEKTGYLEKAAINYELCRKFENAFRLWEKLKNAERAKICKILSFEEKGEYANAALEWEKLNNFENAIINWEKAKNYKKVAEIYLQKKKNYEKAAIFFEKSNSFLNAALCYKKSKNFIKSAEFYYKSGNFLETLKLYKKLKNEPRLIECYLKLNDFYNVGLIYEKKKDYVNAIKYFTEFANRGEREKTKLFNEAKKSKSKISSALRYAGIGDYKKSASIFFEKKFYKIALEQFKALKDYKNVEKCYIKIKRPYEFATYIEDTDLDEKDNLAYHYFLLYLYPDKSYDYERAEKLFKEAEFLKRRGEYLKASTRYMVVNHFEMAYDSFLKLNTDFRAIKYLLQMERYDYVLKFIENKKDISFSYLQLEKIGDILLHALEYNNREAIMVILELFHKIFYSLNEEQIILVNKIFEKLGENIIFSIEIVSEPFLDLLLKLKNYNLIFDIMHALSILKKQEKYQTFKNKILKESQITNDKNLLACCYLELNDREKFNSIMKEIELNDKNYKLFSKSSFYQKAVDYYLMKKDIESATFTCRINSDFEQSARIYKEAGMLKDAAKNYIDAKMFEEALKCYKKLNDYAGIANVYEKMQDYDKAIEIWEKCGKIKQIERLKKKLMKLKFTQCELFD